MSIFIAIASIIGYLLLLQLVSSTITRLGNAKSVNPYRITYITKTINIALTAIAVLLITLMLGIEYTQLAFFASSVFAVLGVAMFAQWSILSNITASLIIFFAFPYRVGDEIKIIDKDDDIQGIVEEITLFHVIIRRGEQVITYPNSLILQKAVIKPPSKAASTTSGSNKKTENNIEPNSDKSQEQNSDQDRN